MRPRGACAVRCPRAPRRGDVGRCAARRRAKPASFARRGTGWGMATPRSLGIKERVRPRRKDRGCCPGAARRPGPGEPGPVPRSYPDPGAPMRRDGARARAVHLRLTRRFVRSRHEARAPAPPRRRRARRRMPLRRRTRAGRAGPARRRRMRSRARARAAGEGACAGLIRPADRAGRRPASATPTGPRTSGPAGRTRRPPCSTSARSRRRSPPPPCWSSRPPASSRSTTAPGDLLPGLHGPAAAPPSSDCSCTRAA